jgi:DNA-3-methyladenine glycosylase II
MENVSNRKIRSRFLGERTLANATRYLAGQDADLAGIVHRYGPPPLWAREEGFGTLIQIILEQQVSLSSAKAAYVRLLTAAEVLTPERFLDFNEADWKAIGFSRQKTSYGRELARSIAEGHLDLVALREMSDDAVRSELMKIKGIGRWTADIYLLMVLRRADVWPRGDLALAVAAQKVKGLASRPLDEELEAMSITWQPWRAVAARLLWHYYLSNRNQINDRRRNDA